MSHFNYLKEDFIELYQSCNQVEKLVSSDPRASAFYARRSAELIVKWTFKHDQTLRLPYQDNISALIHEPTFARLAGPPVLTKLKLIVKIGNQAVHDNRQISEYDATNALKELMHVAYWLAKTYGRSSKIQFIPFDQKLLPKSTTVLIKFAASKLKSIQDEMSEKDEKLSSLLADKANLNKELEELRKQVAEAKKANRESIDTHDYNEEETRDYFIDLLLKEAGWPLDLKKDREFEVEGMPNDKGIGFVDYVLWGSDGKPLGLVEAKRTKRDAKAGENQAKLYADCLEKAFKQRPVIFYSNGYEHYIWDDMSHPPRSIQGFLKKDELELIIQRRSSRKPLEIKDINKKIVERPYQIRAIKSVCEGFEKDNLRKALLVMATGTGKTRTAIALIKLLMDMNWAKRVLFLADRIALVNQTASAFKEHLPSAPLVNLIKNRDADGRVYVSTYPTMMGLINGKLDDARKFGVGHFDLIIIDEAHRSVYQKYRAIFEYFDSYLIGLTATPKDEIDHNTYSLFDLENGVPTEAYTLDEAIEQGYLVPPKPISVPLKFQREGIKYSELSDEEKEQYDAIEWSEDGEKPEEISADAVNKWLFNEDTVDKVIANIMTNGIKVAGGDELGKTIIFAKNQHHANYIKERFDKNYPRYKGKFARVITYNTEYAQNLIDEFATKDRYPNIAISVDMLDTGIDVPEVVNLVLFKLIRSKTKFWQILGRGTRLCSDLFGPSIDKSEFFVFDYCQNLEFFSMDEERKEPPPQKSLTSRLMEHKMQLIQSIDDRRDDLIGKSNLDRDPNLPDLNSIREDTAEQLLEIVNGMSLENFVVRTKRKYVEIYNEKKKWNSINDNMIAEVIEHIADLPSSATDTDEAAKRFDLLCLRIQLCLLRKYKGFEGYAHQVRKIANALLDRREVPAIKTQLELLLEIVEESYWENITVEMIERIRRKIRDLVQNIDSTSKEIIYTDFEDDIGAGTIISVTDATEKSLVKFREKAKEFLKKHLNHISLNKVRTNKPLTETDLKDLEKLFLIEGNYDEDTLKKASEDANGLGLFIRSLIGLDRKAAEEAFAQFINEESYSSNQLRFIDEIINYLTIKGSIPTSTLYDKTFEKIAPSGPETLFGKEDANTIFRILDEIDLNAKLKTGS